MTQNKKMRSGHRHKLKDYFCHEDMILKLFFVVIYLFGLYFVWRHQAQINDLAYKTDLISYELYMIFTHSMAAYMIGGGCVLVYGLLYPFGKRIIADQFVNIGLVNHAGQTPELRRKKRDRKHPNITVWIFRNQSIPLDIWERNATAIEAAMDVTIVKMKYGKSKLETLIYTVPSSCDLPEFIEWDNGFLVPENFVLRLGEGLLGPVTVDLNHIPHILLGGSTGSGKSVLLKLLLMQALHKGAEIYIADFKGGVDFPPVWHEKCKLCFDSEELGDLLSALTDELQRRKTLLKESGCSNLDEYNKTAGEPLKRIVFACDEVAELLDKTGLTKGQRDPVSKIESQLSIIARQGRAFGIHMILATQRPDASILPGQIKNNIDCRICGRADNVLSQIILDNTDAADQIPKDARGRFMLHDGTIFQAYWFDERHL